MKRAGSAGIWYWTGATAIPVYSAQFFDFDQRMILRRIGTCGDFECPVQALGTPVGYRNHGRGPSEVVVFLQL